jgi:hypothetical protein
VEDPAVLDLIYGFLIQINCKKGNDDADKDVSGHYGPAAAVGAAPLAR